MRIRQTADHRVSSSSALLPSCFHMWRRTEKLTFSGFVSNYDSFFPLPVPFPFNVYIFFGPFFRSRLGPDGLGLKPGTIICHKEG